ncbi:hypothetical protein BDW59DRAFT_167310 [Aspergillus cavernicola]|uniref:Uncharacterized protein n=1 Tax=Aspergillus cavernicola TaxID=176166 RepID=A0ABR4HF65_9EURO
MDYKRCADLHNEILRRGWTGSGEDPSLFQPQTWWENEAPSEETASSLSPFLIEFLKRAYISPRHSGPATFFYYCHHLCSPGDMLSDMFLDSVEKDQYVLLYRSTSWNHNDENLGLAFDLYTSTATFISNYYECFDICQNAYSWMPLETILAGYLEMIDEGKVVPVRCAEDLASEPPASPVPISPWVMYLYTPIDVQKAVSAMKHDQLGELAAYKHLVWHDPTTFSEELVPPVTFAFEFLKAISQFRVRFRYLAPGIRFPTVEEFLAQSADWSHPGSHSLRIFQVEFLSDEDEDIDEEEDDDDDEEEEEEEEEEKDNKSSATTHSPSHPPGFMKPKAYSERTLPGVYIEQVHPNHKYNFSNEFRLELPFGIGANGWAQQ